MQPKMEEQVFLRRDLALNNNLNKCLLSAYLVPHTVRDGAITIDVCIALPFIRPVHRHLLSSTQELCDICMANYYCFQVYFTENQMN